MIDTTAEEEAVANAPKLASPEDKVIGEMEKQPVYLKKGPYGYYVQLGDDKGKEKPKRCSLPHYTSPENLTFEQACMLLSLPRKLGNNIEVNIGKFGTYLKQGTKTKSLTGSDTLFNITLERAEEILKGVAAKPEATIIGTNPDNKQEITLNSGRYGPYLKCGKNNYALPKSMYGKEPTLDEALKIINAKK